MNVVLTILAVVAVAFGVRHLLSKLKSEDSNVAVAPVAPPASKTKVRKPTRSTSTKKVERSEYSDPDGEKSHVTGADIEAAKKSAAKEDGKKRPSRRKTTEPKHVDPVSGLDDDVPGAINPDTVGTTKKTRRTGAKKVK